MSPSFFAGLYFIERAASPGLLKSEAATLSLASVFPSVAAAFDHGTQLFDGGALIVLPAESLGRPWEYVTARLILMGRSESAACV